MKINALSGADGTLVAQSAENDTSTSGAYFSNYMDRASESSGDYLERIFDKASNIYNVSKDLLKAMAKAESNFNANATSHCGAMGIMQLMPGTASSLGVTDAYDPEQNIMGGAKYISRLLEKYNNNVSYAVAAYNAGSGNVDKYGGIPPFQETQNYVVKVMKYMQEGVTVPNSSGQTASLMGLGQTSGSLYPIQPEGYASQGSASISQNSSQTVLQDIMDEYFDYDDYLQFLQLFTKLLYEKLAGTEQAVKLAQSGEDEQKSQAAQAQAGAQNTEVQKAEAQAAKPEKILAMKVKGADGIVSTFKQDTADRTDAVKAFQYMTAGGQNRLKVFLNKAAEV